MDSDDLETNIPQERGNILSNGWDVFQPLRLRHHFQNDSRLDKFLLDYHRDFLWYISIIFWVIFLFS